MNRRQVVRTGLTVAMAAAVLGGCSGDDTTAPPTTSTTVMTDEAFAEAVVERCLVRSAVIDETEPDTDPFAVDASDDVRRANAGWFRTFSAESAGLADDIAELEVPDGRVAQVQEMDAALRAVSDGLAELAGKVEAGTVTPEDTGQALSRQAAADALAVALEIPGGLSACGQEPDEVPTGSAVVDVTAVEHAFQVTPEVIAAGPTSFVLANQGSQIHELVLLRAVQPDGINQALAAEAAGADSAQFAVQLGETTAGPGLTGVLNIDDLTPGEYGIVCYVPGPDGVPNAAKGMVALFTVA